MTNLQKVINGYGLVEVPKVIRQEMICCCCMAKWRGKLYTTSSLPTATNIKNYQHQIDKIRYSCYCAYHVEQMFGDDL